MRFICYCKEILWLQQTLFALVMLEHVQFAHAIAVLILFGQLIGNIEPLEVSRTELMLKRGLVLYRDNEDSSDTSDNDNSESSDSEGESMSESEGGSQSESGSQSDARVGVSESEERRISLLSTLYVILVCVL